MTTPHYQPHDDPDKLNRLYWGAGMSQQEIANALGVSRMAVHRAMHRHGIETRGAAGIDRNYSKLYYHIDNPYPHWKQNGSTVAVHQLLAIADGADPHKVFSGGDYHVHHKNEISWDNRPDNIELLTKEEHMRLHGKNREFGREKEYSDQECLEWIDAFVKEFGVVPTSSDISRGPGPSSRIYRIRFGSFPNAVKEAGYTPRGEK